MSPIAFDGQVAIVTGAGRGLGRLYALEMARRGARVVVNDVGVTYEGADPDPSVADAVVDEIVAAGGEAVASHESVATPAAGAAIVGRALDAYGRVDAVVSNAGVGSYGPFEDLSVEQWRLMLQVHLDGAFHVCQPAWRVMKDQRYGRVVLVASSVGAFGDADNAHYAAAKAGLIGLSGALAIEGAEHGIRSNTILPFGFTRRVTARAPARVSERQQQFYDAIAPEKVVPMVVYLASRDCEVTHHNYSAGGGRFAGVFTGLTEGWYDERPEASTAEDIRDHLPAIDAQDGYTTPMAIRDETVGLMRRIGVL
jgi:NAD(P)-dependent dehydrogenase (short-subunit alcohol dehydrogenase family)